VAIPVLPHHGPRGTSRLASAFPTDDPVLNYHGASQAIADVRAVLGAIEARGEPAMLFGISLGGYVAAAVAALEPAVRGVVVGVPVVELATLLRRHAPDRFRARPHFDALCDASLALEHYCSPLELPVPASPVRRVWAGSVDRLVQPDQVERIVARWGEGSPWWYAGGHMGFLTRPGVRRFVGQAMVDAGLAERRRGRVEAMPLEGVDPALVTA
jgi:pimeloyl-ACP methyl ester carboxylesterase